MLDHHYYNEEELEILDHERKNRKQAVNVGMLDRDNNKKITMVYAWPLTNPLLSIFLLGFVPQHKISPFE